MITVMHAHMHLCMYVRQTDEKQALKTAAGTLANTFTSRVNQAEDKRRFIKRLC